MSRSPVRRYGLAVLAVAVSQLARWLAWPLVGPDLPFLFLWPAVLLAAWAGGFGPGLVATLLGDACLGFIVLAPPGRWVVTDPGERAGLAVFVGLGAAVSLVFARLGEAGRQARAQADEIAAERERLRVTLACIAEAVVATGPDGRVTFLNDAARVLTGCGPGDAVGRPLGEVCRFLDAKGAPWPDLAAEVLRADSPVHLTEPVWLCSRGGAVTGICGSAAPIRPPGRDPVGVIVVFRDLAK